MAGLKSWRGEIGEHAKVGGIFFLPWARGPSRRGQGEEGPVRLSL